MKYKKIIFVFVLFSVIGALFSLNAPKVGAITSEEIRVQIQALLSQIAQLQKQLSEIGETEAWCHTFNTNLGYVNQGAEVMALQTALEKEGFYTRAINDTFDEYTASAVVGFQQKYASETLAPWGLKYGTGFVGSTTRAKLNSIYGCGQVSTTPLVTPPAVPVEKSISVLSPNGGETWEIGKTYNIKWVVDNNVSSLKIWLTKKNNMGINSVDYLIKKTNTNVSNSYNWAIPNNMELGEYYLTVAQFKYGLNQETITLKDSSDIPFSIVSATTACTDSDNGKDYYKKGTTIDDGKSYTDYCLGAFALKEYFCLPISSIGLGGVAEEDYVCPNNESCQNGVCVEQEEKSISVISPNGGDVWDTGTTYTIKWKASSQIAKVDIKLLIKGGEASVAAIPGEGIVAGLGEYNWKVPEEFLTATDRFKIAITTTPNWGVYASDESDNYFSIVEETIDFNITTQNYVGYDITSVSKGNEICYKEFGIGWDWMEFHEQVGWSVEGKIGSDYNGRAWVWINDQNSECFSSPNFGMTWQVKPDENRITCNDGIGLEGDNYNPQIYNNVAKCNVYSGDTPCTESRPLVCARTKGLGLIDIENKLANVASSASNLIEGIKELLGR